jgi:hypothetical protein
MLCPLPVVIAAAKVVNQVDHPHDQVRRVPQHDLLDRRRVVDDLLAGDGEVAIVERHMGIIAIQPLLAW